jgi:hypothetical protein
LEAIVSHREKLNGLISPRECWPPEWQALTDEEARERHQQVLETAARQPGLDEIFRETAGHVDRFYKDEISEEEMISLLSS